MRTTSQPPEGGRLTPTTPLWNNVSAQDWADGLAGRLRELIADRRPTHGLVLELLAETGSAERLLELSAPARHAFLGMLCEHLKHDPILVEVIRLVATPGRLAGARIRAAQASPWVDPRRLARLIAQKRRLGVENPRVLVRQLPDRRPSSGRPSGARRAAARTTRGSDPPQPDGDSDAGPGQPHVDVALGHSFKGSEVTR